MKDAHTELQEWIVGLEKDWPLTSGTGKRLINAFALQLGKDGFNDSRDTKEIELKNQLNLNQWEPGVINEGKNTVNKYKDIAEYEPSIKQLK